MYHSITIGEKNTWDDWHLIPSARPVFKQPEQKKKILEIPGADGELDLSMSLTGYPVYNNRVGSLEFNVVNGYKPWYILCSEIANYLSGKTFRAVLEDDKEHFYEGKFSLNEWKSEKSWSKIVIDYNLNPYKWRLLSSTDAWKWDPFNFYDGVITTDIFKNIPLVRIGETPVPHTFETELIGKAPVCPTFTISSTSPIPQHGGTPLDDGKIDIRFVDEVRGIDKTIETIVGPDGGYDQKTIQFPEIVFAGNPVTLYFTCEEHTSGDVLIDFRAGWL